MIEIISAKGTSGTILCNLLMELNLPFTATYIDLTASHHDPKSSVFGRVPVLRYGSVSLTQTTTICLYICERFDHKGRMLSLDSGLRFKQLECLMALATDIQPIIRMLFRSKADKNLEFESFITEAVNYMTTKLQESRGPWFFGDNHSLNDLYAFELMRWVSNTCYSVCLAPITPWMEHCMALDSVRESIKRENLKIWGCDVS
jgi:glutathione S-transferase